ncbi:hypothetical protein FQR65_LT05753 [Abscondita terminalis]|nr:hypothetical protein FQR65_LT05753 [Abscondita terminalis]
MQMKIKFDRVHQYVAASIVSVAVLSVGTTAGWTGNSIDVLLAGQYNSIPITKTFLGWIVSLLNLSSMIFTIPGGIVCDKFGRKTAILFLTIPVIVGWLLVLFANSVDFLLMGRFIIGMGSGALYVLVPMYASEIAEKDIRAKLASFFQLFLTFGMFISYVFGYVIDIRIFTVICTSIPILFFIAFTFQVESPIYKVKLKEYKEAKEVLIHLRGKSYDVDAELEEIKSSLETKQNKVPLRDAFKKRSTKIAMIVSLCLAFFQQMSGAIVISFYVVEVFVSSGSTFNPKEATIVIGALRVLAALGSSSIIELFSRRILLSFSSFISGVGLIILGAYYSLRDRNIASEETLSSLGFMPILGLSIFIIMVSLGLSPMPAIIAAELFPPEIKGVGMSIMGAFGWFLLFLISLFYIDLKSAVGGDGTFYIFAVVCFACSAFAVLVIPETRVFRSARTITFKFFGFNLKKETEKTTRRKMHVNLGRIHQYVAALIASIAVLSVGLAAGWTGNTIDVLLAGQYNNVPLTEANLGWIVSLCNLGAMMFTIPGGIVSDKFGRKTALLLFTAPIITGWLLVLFAKSTTTLLIGRFVIGMGNGSLFMLVPMYASEIAEKDIRAKLASFFQLFLVIGIFLSYVFGYLIDIKIFSIICTATPIVFFVAFLSQVESPIYKLNQEQYAEAKIILTYLRSKTSDVDAEFEQIKLGLKSKQKVSFREAFKKRSTKIAITLSVCLAFFQQISGTIVLTFYVVEIFLSSGSSLHPKKATILIGGLRVLGALASSSIIELFPRRILMSVSTIISGVGLIILGSYNTLKDRIIVSEETLSTLSFMPILGLSIFIVMVSVGLAPMPPIIAAELFPPEIKGFGMAIVSFFSCLLLFLMSLFYIDLKYVLGKDGIFYFFATVCLLCSVFSFFFLPETRGKSLEQIQSELNKPRNVIT